MSTIKVFLSINQNDPTQKLSLTSEFGKYITDRSEEKDEEAHSRRGNTCIPREGTREKTDEARAQRRRAREMAKL